jgi:hypothetical protein
MNDDFGLAFDHAGHSQLADGKRNLVGPQDKLPLTPAGASTIVGPKSK